MAVGQRANATGRDSIAIGVNAQATAEASIAIGRNAEAVAVRSVAIGRNIRAEGVGSFVAGIDAKSTGNGSHSSGVNTSATGNYSTALGYYAEAAWDNSTAYGAHSFANNFGATAIGQSSHAGGTNSTAIGQFSNATGTRAAAFGTNAIVSRDGTQGFGDHADGRDYARGVNFGTGTPVEADLTYQYTGLGLYEEKAYYTSNSSDSSTVATPIGGRAVNHSGLPTYTARTTHDSALGAFSLKKNRGFETGGATRVATILPDGTLQAVDFGFDGIDDLIGTTEGPETLRQKVKTERARIAALDVSGAPDPALKQEQKDAYIAALDKYLRTESVRKHDEIAQDIEELRQIHSSLADDLPGEVAYTDAQVLERLPLRAAPDVGGSLLGRTSYSYEAVGASDFQRQRWADTGSSDYPLGDRYSSLSDQILYDRSQQLYQNEISAVATAVLGTSGDLSSGQAIDRTGALYDQRRYYLSQEIGGFDIRGVLGDESALTQTTSELETTVRSYDTDGDGWISRGEIAVGVAESTVNQKIAVYEYLNTGAADVHTIASIDGEANARELSVIEEYIAAGTEDTDLRRIRNVDEFLTEEGKALLSPATLAALGNTPLGSNPERYGDLYERNAWVQDKIDGLDAEVGRLRQGVAMAAAIRSTHVEPGKRIGMDLNFSEYRGDYGVSGSVAMRLNNNMQFHFAGATTSEFEERLLRTGLNFQW